MVRIAINRSQSFSTAPFSAALVLASRGVFAFAAGAVAVGVDPAAKFSGIVTAMATGFRASNTAASANKMQNRR